MLLFLFLSLVNSAIEYLPKGMSLKFYFPSKSEVEFELWVPTALLSSYDWVSFSLFPITLPANALSGDCYLFVLSSETFQDYFVDANNTLTLDTEINGYVNILNSTKRAFKTFTVLTLNRKLDTGDKFDTKLKKNHAYAVKWALGMVSDGVFEENSKEDSALEYFVLSDEYEDRNSDENNVFGPFINDSQFPVNPPFGWSAENYEWSLYVENYYIGKPFDPEGFYATDTEGSPNNFDLPEVEYS